jgi:hypothetical protein
MPLVVSALIKKHLQSGLDIFDAVEKADEEIRRRQATEAPQAPEGMVAPPETMPGLAAPAQAMTAMAPPQQGQPQMQPDRRAQLAQLIQAMGGGAGAPSA